MNKTALSIISLLTFMFTQTYAQDSLKFPTPTGNPKQLFFLQRSQNINTVVYELSLKNGVLDTIQPVHAFWICYAEKSQREELTEIQKYAYGITTQPVAKDHYKLTFMADKKYVVDLMRGPDKKFHVYDNIKQKRAILSRIYLQMRGGSLFSPNIEYVLFSGTDAKTGTVVSEKREKL